jgi:hypothetical protein
LAFRPRAGRYNTTFRSASALALTGTDRAAIHHDIGGTRSRSAPRKPTLAAFATLRRTGARQMLAPTTVRRIEELLGV